MKPASLRTKLTGAFIAIALFSLALVGILANLFLGKQFEQYAVNRLNTDLAATVEQVSALYAHAGRWDGISLDETGMTLYEIKEAVQFSGDSIEDIDTSGTQL